MVRGAKACPESKKTHLFCLKLFFNVKLNNHCTSDVGEKYFLVIHNSKIGPFVKALFSFILLFSCFHDCSLKSMNLIASVLDFVVLKITIPSVSLLLLF
jgi:hypothetical protein